MFRKPIYAIAAVAALMLAGPMLPVELAVWFSGELLLYLEVISGVWLASQMATWRARVDSMTAWVTARVRKLRGKVSRGWPGIESWLHGALAFQ